MLAFSSMLVPAAQKAGMKIPDNTEDFDAAEFPHFKVFCKAQLERPMTDWGEHWHNAEVIAKIPEDEIAAVTLEDLVHKHGLITTEEV